MKRQHNSGVRWENITLDGPLVTFDQQALKIEAAGFFCVASCDVRTCLWRAVMYVHVYGEL